MMWHVIQLICWFYLMYCPVVMHPLSSHRQHLSYDACFEVRTEIIRTVLCCIVY